MNCAPRALGSRGQATVELVALLPLLLVAGFAGYAVLAAGAAREAARHAAAAGAVALLQERDAPRAARSALPDWARRRALIRISQRAVTVTVRPRTPLPALDERLTARAETRVPADPTP